MVVNLQSEHDIALQYNEREITLKISKAELWFLCMTHRLIVLYNCMKFNFYSFNGCQLTERTRNSIANDQRERTPKISKAELWLLCMTHCLIELYNYMKFHLNNINGCQLTELTRNCIANDQREIQVYLFITRSLGSIKLDRVISETRYRDLGKGGYKLKLD